MFRLHRALLILLMLPGPAWAIQRLQFAAATLEGNGWHAAGLRLQTTVPATEGQSGSADLRADSITLPAPIGQLKTVTIHCSDLQMTATQLQCRRGTLKAKHAQLGAAPAELGWTYQVDTGTLDWSLKSLPLLGGQLTLAGRLDEHGLSLTGKAEATASDAGGRYAADKLGLQFTAQLPTTTSGQRFELVVTADRGQAYVEPVFVDAAIAPVRLHAVGHYRAPQLTLSKLTLQQRGVLHLSGTVAGRLGDKTALTTADLTLHEAQFPAAYQTWLQPFLAGKPTGQLETSGKLHGRLQWSNGQLARLDAFPQQLYVHAPQDIYSIDGLEGEIHWAAANLDLATTQLRWTRGNAYRLPLGAGEVQLALNGSNAALLQPLRIPLLDGALIVDQFVGSDLGTPEMKLDFEGHLEPIQMSALCTALGWPVFGGQLAGELPRLSYKKQVLTLGGTLRAAVFDGQVELENFYLKDPFSRIPRLGANLRARNLDLAQFTQAFSFGKIEGRLDADVEKLRLQNWQPLSFNARLYTPPNDRSRHRISQRAVDHLASIGSGGATAVLSGTALRFFDEFRYDRLGLGCDMSGGVCRMTGVEPGPQARNQGGYYIVKGAGLPRIDVMGFVNQVQWSTLLQQIHSVTQGGAPVIK